MTADDGSHAIDLLEQHPGHFTALVTDFHMPFMTGAHVVMSMRRNYPGIPMIITTALTQVVTDGWRLQYDVGMLAKPYDPETLIAMLRTALAG
jgi:CheY-like chemotaxis protein